MNNETKQLTIQKRQDRDKAVLIEQLRKTPIIEIACKKAGIGRATYYRWRKEDKGFADLTDKALFDGNLLINDMAEAQILRAIQVNDFKAVVFWLKHHHPVYGNKLEITAHVKEEKKQLTPEQEALIDKALKLADLGQSYDRPGDQKNNRQNKK